MNNLKPGYKTTEFWLTLIMAFVALFNQSGIINIELPAETINAAVAGIATYVVSRSGTKAMGAYLAARIKPLDASKLNN